MRPLKRSPSVPPPAACIMSCQPRFPSRAQSFSRQMFGCPLGEHDGLPSFFKCGHGLSILKRGGHAPFSRKCARLQKEYRDSESPMNAKLFPARHCFAFWAVYRSNRQVVGRVRRREPSARGFHTICVVLRVRKAPFAKGLFGRDMSSRHVGIVDVILAGVCLCLGRLRFGKTADTQMCSLPAAEHGAFFKFAAAAGSNRWQTALKPAGVAPTRFALTKKAPQPVMFDAQISQHLVAIVIAFGSCNFSTANGAAAVMTRASWWMSPAPQLRWRSWVSWGAAGAAVLTQTEVCKTRKTVQTHIML